MSFFNYLKSLVNVINIADSGLHVLDCRYSYYIVCFLTKCRKYTDRKKKLSILRTAAEQQ